MPRFVEATRNLRQGDPSDASTDVGPDGRRGERRPDRIVGRRRRSRPAARCWLGGTRDGAFFAPTILANVPRTAKVCTNEAFAPLVVAERFSSMPEAIASVNDSSFGLQAGVFTSDLGSAWSSFNELEVGGVMINDVPMYRVDHMPYGGVKDSGLGREGLRWAIDDMTEIRIMVLAWPQ